VTVTTIEPGYVDTDLATGALWLVPVETAADQVADAIEATRTSPGAGAGGLGAHPAARRRPAPDGVRRDRHLIPDASGGGGPQS
jgi:hypothetical protein